MALIHLDFESEYLGGNTDVNIIVPDRPRTVAAAEYYGSGKKYPVVWLLHGTFGGYSDWLRKSNIELYACEHEVIVVMPGVGNSNYSCWNNFTLGYDAEKYITKELMPLVYGWLPASKKREDNFVAGLSMGGQGALLFGLKYPELFEACAVLSYIPSDRSKNRDEMKVLFEKKRKELDAEEDPLKFTLRQYNVMHRYDTFEEYEAESDDLYTMLFNAVNRKDLPRFLFACGSEDILFADSYHALKEKLDDIGFKAEWTEGPGNHEWRVWDRDIQKALVFFGLSEDTKGNAF